MSQGKGPHRYFFLKKGALGGRGCQKKKMQVSFPGCPQCCDIILKLCLCLVYRGEGPPFVFACLCACLCRGHVLRWCVCMVVAVVGGAAPHRRADTQTGKWEDGLICPTAFFFSGRYRIRLLAQQMY